MKKIAAVAGLVVVTAFGGTTAAAGDGFEQHEVSREQFHTLLAQCRYADTGKARAECRAEVRQMYRIGRTDTSLDCRTFSGITVCGTLKLNRAERACLRQSAERGLSFRRAEVECYALT